MIEPNNVYIVKFDTLTTIDENCLIISTCKEAVMQHLSTIDYISNIRIELINKGEL